MNEEGQLMDERRITDSMKFLKRYPGLSISLEPDPQSGDPEVKVTDLNTGTPIATHMSRTYQRPSLERLGRKLQLAEGLKCALNIQPNISESGDSNILKPAEFRDEDDDCKIKHEDDVACDVVVNKPIKEILQRASMGLNLALNHEDKGNLVRTRSFVINDPTVCLQWQSEPWSTSIGLTKQEPIRLPREESLAVLARARDEELESRPLKEAGNKCSRIQEDIIGEDFPCSRNDKKVITCMNSKESNHKIVEANLSLGCGDDMKGHCVRFENEKEITNNDGMLRMLDTESEANNVAPLHDLVDDGLIHDTMALETLMVDKNSSNLVEHACISSRSTGIIENPKISGADTIQTVNCSVETKGGLISVESFMKMPMHDGRLEADDAALISDSFTHEFISMKSIQESEYDELPLMQREAKVVGPAPTFLDSLNLEIPQLGGVHKKSSSISSHHVGVSMTTPCNEDVLEPCALCMCIKGANLMPCPMDPLNNLQCRLCILETSQEAELLWTHIKHRGCLMALQICLFALVVFRGGLLDMLAIPPPT